MGKKETPACFNKRTELETVFPSLLPQLRRLALKDTDAPWVRMAIEKGHCQTTILARRPAGGNLGGFRVYCHNLPEEVRAVDISLRNGSIWYKPVPEAGISLEVIREYEVDARRAAVNCLYSLLTLEGINYSIQTKQIDGEQWRVQGSRHRLRNQIQFGSGFAS